MIADRVVGTTKGCAWVGKTVNVLSGVSSCCRTFLRKKLKDMIAVNRRYQRGGCDSHSPSIPMTQLRREASSTRNKVYD